MKVRMLMKTAALPLSVITFPALLHAQTTTPETPGTPPEVPGAPRPGESPMTPSPGVPVPPDNPASPQPMPETPPTPSPPETPAPAVPGGIRWAPMTQVPAPAPQAEYPPCTREVQDQCTNTRKGTDAPRRNPGS